MRIEQAEVPDGSLIAPFARADGHYADCFIAPDVGAPLPAFVRAFYTQPLFRAERAVLRVAAGARSSDADVAALAEGRVQGFAVWTVTGRRPDELLLADASGRTLSWLSAGDQLRFGSVVVPVEDRWGRLTLGPVFDALMGAHKLYSRALLAGAARRVLRAQSAKA